MKKILNLKIVLLLIILLAAFFRFWQLGVNPPSLTWDEAAWGYNAYSLGIDGRDEFGRFFPLNYLESFGDFKPPMYAYLDIIPVKLFGLNEFAARFPSALFGILTVLVTYFFTKRIFYKSKLSQIYALLASGMLAISPWHIMLSRAAFEANVASFFLVLGVWLFLAGIQNKKWYIILSAVSFALSLYTFNTARIVAPLLVLILAICFWKTLFQRKKQVIFAVIIGILLVLPTLKFLFSPQAGLRFQEVNIFSDIDVIKTANQEIANDNNAWWSKIIHNRRLLYGIDFVHHYFDNLNPSFLFIKGDGNPKFSTQDTGEMYLWDLPFFIAGIIFIFRKREGNWWIVPLWLVLGIIPAATARETPHALRIEATLPAFQIITAFGLVQLLVWIKGFKIKKYLSLFVIGLIGILLFFNIIYFYHGYMAHYATEFSGEWQYGYKDSINYVLSVQDNYDYIQITTSLGRPYVYYLFYTKTDPRVYRQLTKIKRNPFGFVTVSGFGKYIFPDSFTSTLDKKARVLYISSPYNLPKNIKILRTFYLLNGQPVLIAYTI